MLCLNAHILKGMITLKRFVSILCAIMLTVGMLAVCASGASAAEAAQTTVDVSAGDEINYILTLGGVSKPIIGCDFSVYYDSSLFEVTSVADFTGSTDEGDWEAMINPDLNGEVRGNWSILKGVDFSDARQFLTVNFKAKKAGSGHLSYFIRYMYDDTIFDSTDKPQITEYKFTCDVKINGKLVIEEAQPELNVEETQSTGLFVNSITGDSNDADPEIPKTVAKPEALSSGSSTSSGSGSGSGSDTDGNTGTGSNSNGNSAGSGSNTGSGSNSNSASASEGTANTGADNQQAAQLGTDADGYYITATDAQGNITATSDTAPTRSGGSSAVIWIIVALLVLAGGGAAVFFMMNKKKSPNGAADTNDNK